jgi:hypothetical protein
MPSELQPRSSKVLRFACTQLLQPAEECAAAQVLARACSQGDAHW